MHRKTQGGEVHLQVRASLRRQGWDPSVWWAVHRFWYDQKYSGNQMSMKLSISEIEPFSVFIGGLFCSPPHLSGVWDVRSWLQVPSPQQCFHIPLGIPGNSLTIRVRLILVGKIFYKIFQSLKSRPAWRAKQQEENNARFDEFAREVLTSFHTYLLFITNKLWLDRGSIILLWLSALCLARSACHFIPSAPSTHDGNKIENNLQPFFNNFCPFFYRYLPDIPETHTTCLISSRKWTWSMSR